LTVLLECRPPIFFPSPLFVVHDVLDAVLDKTPSFFDLGLESGDIDHYTVP
jgi:hypothetical protein